MYIYTHTTGGVISTNFTPLKVLTVHLKSSNTSQLPFLRGVLGNTLILTVYDDFDASLELATTE